MAVGPLKYVHLIIRSSRSQNHAASIDELICDRNASASRMWGTPSHPCLLEEKTIVRTIMLRQLAVTDLEHDKPTLPITNRDNKSNTTTVPWLPVRYIGVNLHALWVDARLVRSSRVHQT